VYKHVSRCHLHAHVLLFLAVPARNWSLCLPRSRTPCGCVESYRFESSGPKVPQLKTRNSAFIGHASLYRIRANASCCCCDIPWWRRIIVFLSIKVLPDQRGYVCAGDDGALAAVASFEAASGAEIRRAALHLTGHSGFVTDCDVARTGHGILSSRYPERTFASWSRKQQLSPHASKLVGGTSPQCPTDIFDVFLC